MTITDVLVAEFEDIIKPAIREIIVLLRWLRVRTRVGADTLSKISEQGTSSVCLT